MTLTFSKLCRQVSCHSTPNRFVRTCSVLPHAFAAHAACVAQILRIVQTR